VRCLVASAAPMNKGKIRAEARRPAVCDTRCCLIDQSVDNFFRNLIRAAINQRESRVGSVGESPRFRDRRDKRVRFCLLPRTPLHCAILPVGTSAGVLGGLF
jgi:hypothetical protein